MPKLRAQYLYSTHICAFHPQKGFASSSPQNSCVRWVCAFCNMLHNKEGRMSVSRSKIHCAVNVIKEENLYTSLGFLSDVLSENHMVSPWELVSPYERFD